MQHQDSTRVLLLYSNLVVELIRSLDEYITSNKGTLAELKDRFRLILPERELRRVRNVKKLVHTLEENGDIAADNVEILRILAEELGLPELKRKVEEFEAKCAGIFKKGLNALKAAARASVIHLRANLSTREGQVAIAVLSATLIYVYGMNPKKLEDLQPFVDFGIKVLTLLKGSIVFVLKVSSVASLKQLWQSYQDGSLKEKLKKAFNEMEELKEVSQGEEIEVEVTIDEKEYREVLLDLILFEVKGESEKDNKSQRRHSVCCERHIPEVRS